MAKRRRKHGMTELLLISLTVLVLLAVLTVVLAVVFPDAARSIISDTGDTRVGQGAHIRFVGAIGRRAGEGWDARIAPAVRSVSERLAKVFSGGRTSVKEPKKRTGPVFASRDCTGCHEHEDLFDQTAFSKIYMDHRRHEAAEIACSECHLTIEHPRPKLIRESACRQCHIRKNVADECSTCHPPGSILDDALVSQEETDEFFAGSTARSVSLVPPRFGVPDPQWLKGQGNSPCQNCHQVPAFCNTCHLAFHKDIADWAFVHGQRILKFTYNLRACWVCHSPNWCAGNCHLQAGATRSGPNLALPDVPLRGD